MHERLRVSPGGSSGVASGAALSVSDIVHRYGLLTVIDHVSLEIAAGELVALLGPSGCGKTTLLRIVAGLIQQSGGQIKIGGERIDQLPPSRRNIGVVFQNYALFPHMTVAENVAYGLAARGAPRADCARRVDEMLAMMQMTSMRDRFPKQLSGGQQQRVALARALAVSPRVLLLDESFAALDKNLRLDMQIEVRRIQKLSGITTILVTHDQEEAMSMADRVAVLRGGVLEQFATPTDIYDEPRTLFVNTFVGAANVLSGVVAAKDGAFVAVRLGTGETIRGLARNGELAIGAPVKVCVRPEHIEPFGDSAYALRGTIELSFPLGSTIIHDVRLADGTTIKMSETRQHGAVIQQPGATMAVSVKSPELASVFAKQ